MQDAQGRTFDENLSLENPLLVGLLVRTAQQI